MRYEIKKVYIAIRYMGLLSGIRYLLGIAKEGVDYWVTTPMPKNEILFHDIRVIKAIVSKRTVSDQK